MKCLNNIILINLFCLFLLSTSCSADIQVFTCEPEWQALAIELGGDKISSFSATSGMQDPHQVQARPSLISKIRNADLLICSGADLEIGWLPLLLRRAGNQKLQPNKVGHFFAADHVRLLGIPKIIDRNQGDVHAAGNPHVQTNPKNILRIAKALLKNMKKIDPANAQFYQNRANLFLQKWKQALKKWQLKIEQIKGENVIVQHSNWDYLFDFSKLNQVATIEEKPGIPATSGHLSALIKQLKMNSAKIIIVAAYQDQRASQWLSSHTSLKVVILPFTIGGNKQVVDLFSLYDQTFTLLVNAILNQRKEVLSI